MSYFPLDREILTSSIWFEDPDVFKVWVYLMLKADANTGLVRDTVPAIAANCGISNERALEILKSFEKPDPYSRTKDNDGRRAEILEDGIQLLNYEAHKNKDHSTKRVQRWRERQKAKKKAEEEGKKGEGETLPKRYGNGETVGNGAETVPETNKQEQEHQHEHEPKDKDPHSDPTTTDDQSYLAAIEPEEPIDYLEEAQKRPGLSGPDVAERRQELEQLLGVFNTAQRDNRSITPKLLSGYTAVQEHWGGDVIRALDAVRGVLVEPEQWAVSKGLGLEYVFRDIETAERMAKFGRDLWEQSTAKNLYEAELKRREAKNKPKPWDERGWTPDDEGHG